LAEESSISQDYVPTSVQLSRMLDRAAGAVVSIDWLMAQLGRRSLGFTLLVMAVIGLLPGVSMFMGPLVAWLAVQMVLGHEAAALPQFVARRSVPVDRLARVIGRVAPGLAWIERLVQPRWPMCFQIARPMTGIVTLLLGLSLLLPVPFTQVVTAPAIMLLALAYLEEDGIALLVALMAALVALSISGAAVWGTVETVDWLDLTR
jgi:hypothetical protein